VYGASTADWQQWIQWYLIPRFALKLTQTTPASITMHSSCGQIDDKKHRLLTPSSRSQRQTYTTLYFAAYLAALLPALLRVPRTPTSTLSAANMSWKTAVKLDDNGQNMEQCTSQIAATPTPTPPSTLDDGAAREPLGGNDWLWELLSGWRVTSYIQPGRRSRPTALASATALRRLARLALKLRQHSNVRVTWHLDAWHSRNFVC